jgi:hypothetical protein
MRNRVPLVYTWEMQVIILRDVRKYYVTRRRKSAVTVVGQGEEVSYLVVGRVGFVSPRGRHLLVKRVEQEV